MLEWRRQNGYPNPIHCREVSRISSRKSLSYRTTACSPKLLKSSRSVRKTSPLSLSLATALCQSLRQFRCLSKSLCRNIVKGGYGNCVWKQALPQALLIQVDWNCVPGVKDWETQRVTELTPVPAPALISTTSSRSKLLVPPAVPAASTTPAGPAEPTESSCLSPLPPDENDEHLHSQARPQSAVLPPAPVSEHEANLAAASDETRALYLAYYERTKNSNPANNNPFINPARKNYSEVDAAAYWTWDRGRQQWYHRDEETKSIVWFFKGSPRQSGQAENSGLIREGGNKEGGDIC